MPEIRRRATWLGIVSGLATKFLVSFLLVALTILLSQKSAAELSATHGTPEGPLYPGSFDWFVLQAINVASSVLGGFIGSRMAPRGSLLVPAVLIALMLALTTMAMVPTTNSLSLLALWALGAPLGFAGGALLHWRLEPSRYSLNGGNAAPGADSPAQAAGLICAAGAQAASIICSATLRAAGAAEGSSSICAHTEAPS
jgi:hypothetical protein